MPVKSTISGRAHYHEGAPAPHLRAAREALPADQWPDLDQLTEGGHAVTVAHGRTDRVRSVAVQLAMDTPRKLHTERPMSDQPGRRWDQLTQQIAALLQSRGFTDVRTTNMGVWAEAPHPAGLEVEFVVAPHPELDQVGVYRVTCRTHPELTATIDGGFHHGVTSGSGGYQATDSQGRPVGSGHRTAGGYLLAARDYATYCGIPDPLIRITDLDAVALRILDAAYEQAGTGRVAAVAEATVNGHQVIDSAKSQRINGQRQEPADGPTRDTQKKLATLIAYAMNNGGGRLALVSHHDGTAIVQRWNLTRHGATQTPLFELPPGQTLAPAPPLH
ncbi:hypothetical protein [Streptomyces sp. AP-93]|uniref:hypothetical protein n=1 Tax=Streptomyces sp. AP-93 TaxID=2929048 RepID=UPI001FAED451|nr:hypothetical protein [Streptomyces sp. AP-93]MCJ0875625.1 hypothetical protein [Streptomyces sp. AP-93]